MITIIPTIFLEYEKSHVSTKSLTVFHLEPIADPLGLYLNKLFKKEACLFSSDGFGSIFVFG